MNSPGWKLMGLDQCYWFQEGPGVRKWQFTNSGIKLLNVANIEKTGRLNLAKSERHLSVDEVEKRYSHFLIDAGDLVIASSGISFDEDGLLRTRGVFVESEHLPLCLNTSTIRFKAKPDVSSLAYLKHWLDSIEFRQQITKLVTGSAQQNFGPSHLKALKILLPPLPEQRRIAAILDKADALRAKRRAALAQLDELTQSIFIEMFGVDHCYPERTLEQLCELITDGTHQTPTYSEEGVIFLSAKNVTSGRIDWSSTKFIPEWLHKELHGRLAPRLNDILLAKNGTTGVAAIVDRDCVFDIYVSLALLRPKRDALPSYLHAAINSPMCKRQFNGALKGIGVPNLHLKEIRSTKIPHPPVEKQKQFEARIDAIQALTQNNRSDLSELDILFTSLQHCAFRGEL